MFEDLLRDIPPSAPRAPGLLPGLRITSDVTRRLLFPIGFVLLFAMFPVLLLLADPQMRTALRGSESVTGQVVSVSSVGENGRDRSIKYRFTTRDGAAFEGKCTCSPDSEYYDVKSGDQIPVRYQVGDPDENSIGAKGSKKAPPVYFFVFFPLFGLIVLLPTVVPEVKRLVSARRIFKHGVLGKGKVVFVKRHPASFRGGLSSPPSDVFIAYRLPNGQPAEGRTSMVNDWLLSHLAPGSEVNIAFRPEKPAEVILLEAYIR